MWRVFAAPLMIMHRRNRLTAPGGLRLTLPVIEPRHLLCRHIYAGDFRAQFDTQRRLANIFGWCGVVRFWDACFKMDAPNKNPANRAGLSREVGSSPPSMRRADSILSKQCSRAEAGYVLQRPVISSQGTQRLLSAFLQAKASLGQRSSRMGSVDASTIFSVFARGVRTPI